MSFKLKKIWKNTVSRIKTSDNYHSSRPSSPSLSTHSVRNEENPSRDHDFFDGKSHAVIFSCLNDGYQVFNDLLSYITDFREASVKCADAYQSWSNKWISRLDHQSANVSYNTTKKAQRIVLTSGVDLAALKRAEATAVDSVITELQQEISRLYLNVNSLIKKPEHYRSEELKNDFATAFAPVRAIEHEIKQMRRKRTDIEHDLHQAAIQEEDVTVFEPDNEEKLRRAQQKKKTLKDKLEQIDESLDQLEETLSEHQETYRTTGMSLFKKFQEYEKERLDLIQKILLKFIEVAYSTSASSNLDELYEKVRTRIEEEQNTEKDLEFWANKHNPRQQRPPSPLTHNDESPENAI